MLSKPLAAALKLAPRRDIQQQVQPLRQQNAFPRARAWRNGMEGWF
jgi:hypothetical protein